MKVSAENGDYDYIIYLDGKPVDNCISADDQRGEVVAYWMDSRGGFIPDKKGGLLRRTLRGKVEIKR